MLFNIKKSYNFNTLVPSILGTNFKNMKVIGGPLTARLAVNYLNVYDQHEQIKAANNNITDRVEDLNYIIFETMDGVQVVLPEEYIEVSSIVEVTKINFKVTMYDVDQADILVIRNRLQELGYANFKVETFV